MAKSQEFPVDILKIVFAFKVQSLICINEIYHKTCCFSSVQSLSHVWLFATPWTVARQASLSNADSQSLLKLMSIELVMPSNHLIVCCPLLLPLSIFQNQHQGLFQWVGSSHHVAKVLDSVSASVLPMNIQDWFSLGWTSSISLQSKGLSRVSNTTVQKHQFFGTQLSL